MWWKKAVPIQRRPAGPWAIGLAIRSSPFQRPCAGQTCATSPTLVSRTVLAIPNPKTSPSQPQHHPGLIPCLGPPQPQLHALPQDRSPAQIFPYPKHISSLTPFPSPTPIPSQLHFIPNTLQLKPILLLNVPLIPSSNQPQLISNCHRPHSQVQTHPILSHPILLVCLCVCGCHL